MKDTIAARLERLEERIEAACQRSGRDRSQIELMGVTKFHPLEAVEEAYQAGLRLFGENRVQEGIDKYTRFLDAHPGDSRMKYYCDCEEPRPATLHLIGSLQRNKAKAAAAFFDCIQSVDRDPLIETLGTLTAERKSPLMVMLEYHTGEESKAGYPDMDSLFRAAEKVLSCPGMRPIGLMTMAPFTDDKTLIRSSFRKLARALGELKKRFPYENYPEDSSPMGFYYSGNWTSLSMGMTNDFEIAIEEGSTMLRMGTSIFGERIT